MEALLLPLLQLFAVIGLGSILIRWDLPIVGRFDGEFWRQSSRLCYNVCLASLLFLGTSRVQWDPGLGRLVVMTAIALLALAAAAVVCAWVLPVPRDTKWLVAVVAFNPSSAFFGIPLAVGLFGEEIIAEAALVSTVETGIATALGVAILGGKSGTRATVRSILSRVCVDPLVFSTLAGVCLSIVGVKLPGVLVVPLQQLASAAIPLALLTIGANIRFRHSRIAEVLSITLIKLAVAPLVVAATLTAFGYSGRGYMLILLLLSAPVALVMTILVDRYTENQDFATIAANAVALSTSCSIVTLAIIVYSFS